MKKSCHLRSLTLSYCNLIKRWRNLTVSKLVSCLNKPFLVLSLRGVLWIGRLGSQLRVNQQDGSKLILVCKA